MPDLSTEAVMVFHLLRCGWRLLVPSSSSAFPFIFKKMDVGANEVLIKQTIVSADCVLELHEAGLLRQVVSLSGEDGPETIYELVSLGPQRGPATGTAEEQP